MSLPGYASSLSAYHRAFATELQAMLKELPFCLGDRILDVGCGEGTYTSWLSNLVGPGGQVVGVDHSADYLKVAKRHVNANLASASVRFVRAEVTRLPFKNNHFDAVWCAQNLYSFPNAEEALHELVRVVRPGGIVAILENDSLHYALLPWPVDVELILLQSQHRSFKKEEVHSEKFYIARGLRSLLKRVGCRPQRKHVYALHREAPFTTPEKRFLQLYLQELRERTQPYLTDKDRERVEPLLNPRSPYYLLRQEELTLTCLDHIAWGKKSL